MIRKSLVRLVFLLLGLLILLAASGPAFAQGEKVDLSLQLSPGYYSTDLVRGEDNFTYLEVRNNGNLPVNNIRFSAGAPEGWRVEFNPAGLETLAPGSSHAVDVNIVPPVTAGSRNYNITLIAEADETRAASSIFLTVERNTSIWTWIGIGLGIAALIVFFIIFWRFGRN
jgi:uncharacterized membrane protein